MQTNTFEKFIKLMVNPYFIITWFTLALLSFFYVDRPLAMAMHHLYLPWVKTTAWLFTLLGTGGPYLGMFLVLFLVSKFVLKKENTATAGLFGFLTLLTASIVCDVLKIVLGRSRPRWYFYNHVYGFHFFQFTPSMWSFPSGHATIMGCLVIVFSYLFPRYWLGFLTLALLTCFSRVVLTAHFLSDVMIGFYLGILIAITVHKILANMGMIKLAIPNQDGYDLRYPSKIS